jgi:hypothetical protein
VRPGSSPTIADRRRNRLLHLGNSQTSALFDGWGVIHDAAKRLPSPDLKPAFIEALAELEDHECHRTRKFPKTRLHRVVGYKVHLKDIVDGRKSPPTRSV